MGGDRFTVPRSSLEDESSIDQEFSQQESDDHRSLSCEGFLPDKVDNGAVDLDFVEFGDIDRRNSPISIAFEVNRRRNHSTYVEVLATYDDLQPRSESLTEAKNTILSYTPGSWIDKAGGCKNGDYSVPQTTSLLLIGPKGSGKSSLVNKISRFFEHDKFLPERAQVSNGSFVGQGTFFLQEYMIPRGSHSFCLYDTRGLSDDSIENKKMFERWLTRGVRHGELVQRASDDADLNSLLKSKHRQSCHVSGVNRVVNFVIVVVNGISVLESLHSDDEGKKQYSQMIATIFNYPFLSFKDDMPVIVVTHGDLLTLADRARIRVYLGNLLGIPPKTQILDIPENNNKATELAIVDLLSYCLDRADRNLPLKKQKRRLSMNKMNILRILACILLLGIGYIITSMQVEFILSYVNKPPNPTLSCFDKRGTSDVNRPLDPAPTGSNTPPNPAPSGVKKTCSNSASPSGVKKAQNPASPSGVKKAQNPASPSGVKKAQNPASVGVDVNWFEIRHLWLDEG